MATPAIGEMHQVANFEIVAPSPLRIANEQAMIYQELQPTLCDSWKDIEELSCGHSPDQGYESEESSSGANLQHYSADANIDDYSVILTEVTDLTYTSAPGSSDDTASDLYCLKLEEIAIDEMLPSFWSDEQHSFTQALKCEYDANRYTPMLSSASCLDLQVNPSHGTCSFRSNSESEMSMASCSSVDSGIYASSSPETTLEELEISEGEDIECEITNSPLPGDASPKKKRRRRKRTSKQPILWRFLLNALNEPETYGSMIHWVDKSEGTFQFTTNHKEELSKKWGEAKNNRCVMTYQKMARAMRNYINRREVLQKVKKKLQYTFIPSFYADIRHMVK